MTHTTSKVYLHIVFSTRKREPLIEREMKDSLFRYIGGICKSLQCPPVKIGGHNDHVHILCLLNRNLSMLELIEEIKIASSRWIRNRFAGLKNFSWQQGYAGVSVGDGEVPTLCHYIENQEQHHASLRFEDELKRLLVEHAIQFDEAAILK